PASGLSGDQYEGQAGPDSGKGYLTFGLSPETAALSFQALCYAKRLFNVHLTYFSPVRYVDGQAFCR
ncbi:hypothetical protein ABMA58_11105, partial [Oceanospirillum sp. HFRX-1_2]